MGARVCATRVLNDIVFFCTRTCKANRQTIVSTSLSLACKKRKRKSVLLRSIPSNPTPRSLLFFQLPFDTPLSLSLLARRFCLLLHFIRLGRNERTGSPTVFSSHPLRPSFCISLSFHSRLMPPCTHSLVLCAYMNEWCNSASSSFHPPSFTHTHPLDSTAGAFSFISFHAQIHPIDRSSD